MEKRKQLPIRLNPIFLKEIRLMLVIEDMTFQDYVVELIKKDMDARKNKCKSIK